MLRRTCVVVMQHAPTVLENIASSSRISRLRGACPSCTVLLSQTGSEEKMVGATGLEPVTSCV